MTRRQDLIQRYLNLEANMEDWWMIYGKARAVLTDEEKVTENFKKAMVHTKAMSEFVTALIKEVTDGNNPNP